MKKRLLILPALLVFIMMLTAFPVFAENSGDWEYELSEVGLTITAYHGADKAVVIPNEIDGYKVTVIGDEAFRDNTTMTSIVIPEGITGIGNNAFYGCNKLSQIEFNAKNCTIPGVNTYKNRAGIFSGAGSASTSGLKVIFGEKVSEIPASLFDTASLDGVDGHGGNPYAYVTSVNISDSVKNIGDYAFRGCRDLETVSFGGKEQTIGIESFSRCSAIKNLTFGSTLTSIGDGAFFADTSLESITWGQNLDSIGKNAFKECTSLPSVSFVNPLTTISESAFENCTTLKEILLPESLTNLYENAFYGCINLNAITIESKNLTVTGVNTYKSNYGAFCGAGSASPKGLEVVIGTKVAKVPDSLFDTASLDGVDGHGGHPYAYVTSVTFENGVKEIGSCAFRNCQSLETINFGETIQTIGSDAFVCCSSLTELDFNKELTYIGESAFKADTGLEKIVWGEKLDTIDNYAFESCTSLTKVHFVNPLTTIGRSAFSGCTTLKQVLLPESLTNINENAFYGCISLNQIIIKSINLTSANVNTYKSRYGVFSGAGSASPIGLEVIFYKGVTKIPAYILDTASLDGADGHGGHEHAYVTSIICASTVKEVGDCAFRSLQNLENIHFYGKDVTFGENVFENCVNPSFCIEGPGNGTLQTYAGENSVKFSKNNSKEVMPEIEDPEKATLPEAGKDSNIDAHNNSGSSVEKAETWTCPNGHTGNTGKFCSECGSKKPAQE